MEFDEKTYEEWFEKYLGEIESLTKTEDNSPLRYQPKIFRFWAWFLTLSILMIACGVISFFIYSYEAWLSNLLLNLSAGLLASIIILFFTTAKEKQISYCNDVLPLLRERYKKMKEASHFPLIKMQISRQNNDINTYYNLHKLLSNTHCVILSFVEYLDKISRYVSKDLKECIVYKDKFFKTNTDYIDLVWEINKSKDTELFKDIEKKEMDLISQSMYMLNIIKNYIQDLTDKFYSIRYNKRKNINTDFDYKKFEKKIKK